MAKNTTLAAGTSPFAHLLGGMAAIAGLKSARRADDDRDKPDAEENDRDENAEDDRPEEEGRRAEDDKPDAEEDDDKPGAEGEDDDAEAEEPSDPKQRKAYRSGMLAGSNAANKRARAIFAHKAAAGRPDLAAQLAFDTRMSAGEATRFLAAANVAAPGASRARTLDDRMGNRNEPRPGAGGDREGKPSFAERAAAAAKKAGVR